MNRQSESVLAAALRRTGPAHPLTRVKEAVLVELSEELDGNCTWDEITKRFNEETGEEVSTSTVHRFCKSRGWHEVCNKYVPCFPALRLTLL